MRQIEFIRPGSNTILGNFAPGDLARCGDALAKHLVDEVGVAKYAIADLVKPAENVRQTKRHRRSSK